MIYWYDHLYTDDVLCRKKQDYKKVVEDKVRKGVPGRILSRKMLPGKHYYLLVLASNQENLFEIVNTNQMFFRYYEYTNMYIVGIAKRYDGAVEILRRIMTEGYGADLAFDPRSVFTKNRFFPT